MTLPRISITSELAQLSVRSVHARFKQDIESTELEMNNEFASIEMDVTQAKVHIDQTESFATSGLKKIHRQAMDYYKEMESKSEAVAGRISEEGEEFVRIERNSRPIQSQSKRIWAKDPQLTIVSMPSARPEINTEMGEVKLTYNPGHPNARFKPVESKGHYQASESHVSWLQQPYLKIDAVPGRISGTIVDTIV